MLFTLLLVSLLVGIILFEYFKWLSYAKQVKNIPSPPSWPIIGHAAYFYSKHMGLTDLINELRRTFKKIVVIWLGPLLNVIVTDAKYLEIIFSDYKKTIKGPAYDNLGNLVGNAIIRSHGPIFDQSKNIVMKCLCTKNIVKTINEINQTATNIIEKIPEHEGNLGFYIRKFVMSSLLSTVLGIDQKLCTEDELKGFVNAIKVCDEILTLRSTKLLLYPEFLFKYSKYKAVETKQIKIIDTLIRKIINEKRQEIMSHLDLYEGDEDKVKPKRLLEEFLLFQKNNKDKISETQIRDEVVTTVVAGHETSVVSIGLILCHLGKHQEIQKKVYEEITQVFGDSMRPVTYEDTLEMKYLYQVMEETWRLFPPVNHVARSPTEDLQVDKFSIPKGSQIFIPLKYIHLDAEVFPNPEKFNPDNFTDELVRSRHKFSYLPFSTGYRKCVGTKFAIISIKIFLITFLRKYEVHCGLDLHLQDDFKVFSTFDDSYKVSITNRA